MHAIATDSFCLQAYFCIFKAIASPWDSCRKLVGAKLNLVDALLTTVLPRNLNPANNRRVLHKIIFLRHAFQPDHKRERIVVACSA